ncbi:polysaccharide deacetylase family protein [Planobispora siamensis]|uniref:Xylanase n=1 Tax=Planobispora siamensis TaxID=936338 RepID=A0A8J3WMJ9_9ACTN|nr:polysaccharide deacetylase family protein [Planobispora siamensis]GIH92941.1 xylanase [Planobispora siamensis]
MSRLSVGRAGVAVVAAGTLVTGCMPWDDEPEDKGVTAAAKASAAAVQKAAATKARTEKAAKAKANELGQIPVLMYHRVVDKPTNMDDRTPKQFRTELERLAKDGYVPITAAEYVTGRIDIPEGRHAVVLTFDDASPSQLTLDGTGTPAPNTAVAILADVAKRNPGFRPVATFYVTRDMFGKATPEEQTQMLAWLHDNGYDIGNHTKNHENLLGKPKKQVTAEISAGHRLITDLIEAAPVTLALPYGNQPSTKEWGLKGRSGDVSYNYGGVFRAGYTPAPSPFSKDFDPVGIPRIRAMDKKGSECSRFCSTAWLDWLEKNADERYTSDGDVETVAFPKFKKPFLTKGFTARAVAY